MFRNKFFLLFAVIITVCSVFLAGCGNKYGVKFSVLQSGFMTDFESMEEDEQKVSTLDELKKFSDEYRKYINFETDHSIYTNGTVSIDTALEKYDNEFFENNFLALKVSTSGTSTPFKYSIKSCTIEENILNVKIKYSYGNTVNAAVGVNLLILEVKKSREYKYVYFEFL